MNSLPDDPIEARLARVQPAVLPPALSARLRAARPTVAPAAPPSRVHRWFLPAAAAAAVLTLLAWAVPDHSPGPRPLAGNPEPQIDLTVMAPLESRQHLLSVTDLGIVRDSRDRPVRLVSSTWLDENAYGQPGEAPALRQSQLRSEITPVLLTTY